MKLHEALARTLGDCGTNTMFGLMGDGNMFFADSFARLEGNKFIASAHESGAATMANGYASVSGELGVVTVTHGPGLANALPPLIDSVRGRTPIVVVVGDTDPHNDKSLQNIEHRELTLPTGAGFEQVRSNATAVHDMSWAIRRAHVERRPIILNVPAKLMWDEVEYIPPPPAPAIAQALLPDDVTLELAVEIAASARRPLILAGRGAATPGARRALLRLAERLGAPLSTTLKGLDLFRGERFNLGVCGTSSSPIALDTVMASDCILAFGASLNPWTTDSWALLMGKRVVQCDLDPQAIGRHGPVNVAVVGDVERVAAAMERLLDEAEIPPSSHRSEELARKIAEHAPSRGVPGDGDNGTVDHAAAMLCLERDVPTDRTLVVDAGRFMFEAYHYFHAPEPYAFVHTSNFSAIGLGMGNAIGAAVAAPDRPALLVCGDGGFMLGGLTEFTTAVQNGLDIIVAVFNDSAYGAEHVQFRRRELDPTLTTFNWPDLAPVAQALGGRGLTVRRTADFVAVAEAVSKRDRPLLIDIKVDPNLIPYDY